MQVYGPFGLRPAFHPSGYIRPVAGTITSAYASNIFLGAPVGYIADGSIALSPVDGTGITGACGAFQGVEYTEQLGRRVVSNFWPAATVATEIVAYFTNDPQIVYEIQANAAITQAAIGQQFNWTTNGSANGNTTTGISTVGLNVADTAANAGLRVVGLTPGPDNAWSDGTASQDPFPIVQVQLSEHQFVATIVAI